LYRLSKNFKPGRLLKAVSDGEPHLLVVGTDALRQVGVGDKVELLTSRSATLVTLLRLAKRLTVLAFVVLVQVRLSLTSQLLTLVSMVLNYGVVQLTLTTSQSLTRVTTLSTLKMVIKVQLLTLQLFNKMLLRR
jgi:hypothetical protein